MTPRQLLMLATEHRYATDPKAHRPLNEQVRQSDSAGTAAFAVALGTLAGRRRAGGATT